MSRIIRILGIDPGLRNTGWGMIASEGSRLSFLACGSLHSDADLSLAERLHQLHSGLCALIAEWQPDEAAIEETFVNKDARSALKLGQARGVLMVPPAAAGIPVAEYAPNQIKKAVVGAGHAEKAQVQHMLKVLLPKAVFKSADAADARAVAVCHAHMRGVRDLAKALARG